MPEETKTTTVADALKELLNRKLRLWLYVITSFALLCFSAWEASDGDWFRAAFVLVTSLVPILAAANINPAPEIQLIPGDVGAPGPKGDRGPKGVPGDVLIEGPCGPLTLAALEEALNYDKDTGRYVPEHTGESTEDGEHSR